VSRDIFVQDLPREARTAADIPDDFQPQPIGSSQRILDAVRQLDPGADFSDPAWGRIERPDYSIEVNLPHGENIRSFALHVRGVGADAFVMALLRALDLRALDGDSEEGLILPSD
jgi:hypothetical protein